MNKEMTLPCAYSLKCDIPTLDMSHVYKDHVVIADGGEQYQGHPTTVLMPDGKTVFCVWTIGHGGCCGLIKKSTDGGKTWSELLPVPENWTTCVNCPTIWHIPTNESPERLTVYAQEAHTREMFAAFSDDGGNTWSEMMPCGGIVSVMPWTSILPLASGRLLGMTNARSAEDPDPMSNIIIQAWSDDHGRSWHECHIVANIPGAKLCEPWIIPSPDGTELACLLRANNREYNSMIMFSSDFGKTWSNPKELPDTLTGDRHIGRYLPDGRLFVVFRDVSKSSPSYGHFCGWVGCWNDLKECRSGDFRIKLLQHYTGRNSGMLDCGYPGLEVFKDGTVLTTTYIRYRPGDKYNSVVSVKFNPFEVLKDVHQSQTSSHNHRTTITRDSSYQ